MAKSSKRATNGAATAARRAPRIAPDGNGNGQHTADDVSTSSRLPVLKTYKIYVGGKFPRTESGRYYVLKSPSGDALANVCRCSRKDFRDAVVAARAAQSSWASKSAYNRGQILYRIAEMLEGRAAQFVAELVQQGSRESQAKSEVAAAIDRFLYYAGCADQYH